jgi:hypothetical protein
LNAQQDLLDCDGRLPTFLFIQDGEADSARWVNIWVEERRYEFTLEKGQSASPSQPNVIVNHKGFAWGEDESYAHLGGLVGYSISSTVVSKKTFSVDTKALGNFP